MDLSSTLHQRYFNVANALAQTSNEYTESLKKRKKRKTLVLLSLHLCNDAIFIYYQFQSKITGALLEIFPTSPPGTWMHLDAILL